MNTHDCAKHTHAGPLWATNTHETHTMGSSGKLFPMESPDSLECESQLKPQSEVLLARAHEAPCGFPYPGTALAGLGAELPLYPWGPSTGPEALCGRGPVTPASSRYTTCLLNCVRQRTCLLAQHNGTFSSRLS